MIQTQNETLDSATCQRCGARLYPQAALEAHELRHTLKDMRYEHELGKLQTIFAKLDLGRGWERK